MWCHNPEGLSYKPQLMVSMNNCLHCGACIRACPNGGKTCTACGRCIRACPQGLRKLCGKRYTAQELAQKLLRDKDYLAAMSGGVTFSGGEPTGQPEFLLETLDRVAGMHRAIETSGYCSGSVFEAVLARVEYVMMDLKLMDPEQHRHYTGVSNEPILETSNGSRKAAGRSASAFRSFPASTIRMRILSRPRCACWMLKIWSRSSCCRTT